MADKNEGRVVRQHERLNCALRAELRVSPEHAERVIVSSAAGETNGSVPVTLIDLSNGGVGVKSKVFFPKQARMVLRIWAPGANGADRACEFAVRIQRVQMLDRTPVYYLGAAFSGEGTAHNEAVNSLMQSVRLSNANAPAAGSVA